MNNSQKILKMLSGFIEAGILTTNDLRKELLTAARFQKEELINKLDLVKREELNVLKKIIEKQLLIAHLQLLRQIHVLVFSLVIAFF